MIKSFIPRVAVINDLSGFGRVSLSEACPILSAMGIESCPLPTAVLSTHTYKFSDYTFLDLTKETEKILNHWREIDIKFEAICTGYMASPEQIEIISEFIKEKKNEESIIVIDPVLGDNDLSDAETVYYDRMNSLLLSMKKFVNLADVITPNLTEACLLLDKKYPNHYLNKNEIKEIAVSLSKLGPKKIAITSVMTDENHMFVAVYDKDEDIFEMLDCGYIKRPFHGTGDIFAAVLTGGLAKKNTMLESSKKAVEFIKESIAETLKYEDMQIEYGVVFEKALKSLIK
ncbi:MAG: pyridoxamine kinase [Clostridia bacterium]|nr:pyridoxamine kinase [Clostridia bacterium]